MTRLSIVGPVIAMFVGVIAGCGGTSSPKAPAAGVVETTTTTVPAGMTFAECQKSAEYPGGRYSVSFDNGVCTVQKPAEVAYASCDEVRAAGKAPLHVGAPGYSSKLDRDGDGTACDA
jgi:hypothetical protein